MDTRIKDLATTSTVTASDDYLPTDGTTNGTRKLSAYSPRFGGNLTVDGSITGGSASLTTPLPLTSGGTGASTQAGAANAVLPTQSTSSGKFLTTDGSNVSWGTPAVAWGSITGTLSNQTDLNSALSAKANTTSLAASATTDTTNADNITSGTLSVNRLSGITSTQLSATAGITNAQLSNSSITIAGTTTSLGGTISLDTITGLSTTGLVKRTAANTLAIATSSTDYAPATTGSSILAGNGLGGFTAVSIGSGVSYTGGTLSAAVVSVASKTGAVTLTGSDVGLGNLTNDTQTKAVIVPNTTPTSGQILVGNAGGTAYAPVSSSGDVTVASTGAFTIGASKVTNAMLAGSIDLTTKVTGALPVANGGTGATSATTAATNLGLGTTSNVTFNTVSDAAGGIRTIPQSAKTSAYTLVIGDVGKHISITTGGVTVPASIFSAGDVVSIYNNSASNQTITQGTSATVYLAGTSTTGNRTLAQRGICTVLCVASNTFVISGGGLT